MMQLGLVRCKVCLGARYFALYGYITERQAAGKRLGDGTKVASTGGHRQGSSVRST
jgi:hypothetical protein